MAENDAVREPWLFKFVSKINPDLMLDKEPIRQIVSGIKEDKMGVQK